MPAAASCNATCEAAFNTTQGADYNGNDLPNTPVSGVDTLDSCKAACYANAQCAAFTFLPSRKCESFDPAGLIS